MGSEGHPLGEQLAASVWQEDAATLGQPFLELLPVTGVSIAVFDQAGQQSTIYASSTRAALLDETQFDLGEGPAYLALRSARPVLLPDVFNMPPDDWPLFSDAVISLEVGALFALPMTIGAVCIGVVSLYRDSPGELGESLDLAVSLARSVAGPALRRAVRSAGQEDQGDSDRALELRREVHQATGMVLAQLDTSATDAFSRLRAYAFSNSRTVQDVAKAVIRRQLDFSELPD